MSIYSDHQGHQLKPFLDSKAQAAYSDTVKLTRAALPKNKQFLIDEIVSRHSVAPLKLSDKPKFELPENNPLKAFVTWQITGDTQMLGCRDSIGNYLPQMKGKNFIKDDFTYSSPIAEHPHILEEIKKRVTAKAQAYQAHFDRLNTEAEQHNQYLADNVTTWVDKRLDTLAKQKAAEDLLNSN